MRVGNDDSGECQDKFLQILTLKGRLELYSGALHRFVKRRVNNPADAADIAQQCLLQACRNLDRFRGGSILAWLFAIARHSIADFYRSKRKIQFLELSQAALSEREPALKTAHEAVFLVCERRERVRCWLECIRRCLRLDQQIAILLADIYGYRDKESAAAMTLSVPSFKLLLHDARAHLHEVAGGRCRLVEEFGAAGRERAAQGLTEDLGSAKHTRRASGLRRRPDDQALTRLRNDLLEGLSQGLEL